MEHLETITIGIFIGVLTALLLALAKHFWVMTLIPFWQKIRYQGADISGSWIAEYKYEDKAKDIDIEIKLSLVLSQNAHSVCGSMHFNNRQNQTIENIDFALNGSYWEGYLTLNLQSKDRKIFSGGTMYLKSVQNGLGLKGHYSFRDSQTDSVMSPEISFFRT